MPHPEFHAPQGEDLQFRAAPRRPWARPELADLVWVNDASIQTSIRAEQRMQPLRRMINKGAGARDGKAALGTLKHFGWDDRLESLGQQTFRLPEPESLPSRKA